MKIYISLPITGRDIEEVEAECIFAKGVIEKLGHEAVSPLEVTSDPDATYAEHLGNDITALLGCDAVLFLGEWRTSQGCKLERNAARIYRKLKFTSFEQIEEYNEYLKTLPSTAK